MGKKKKIGLLLLLVLLLGASVLGFEYFRFQKTKEEAGQGQDAGYSGRSQKIVDSFSLTYLEGETEPEELGNQEAPIPLGEKDPEGSNMAKFSQEEAAATIIKGLVLVINKEERALTLKQGADDRIKLKVSSEARWFIQSKDGTTTNPDDYFSNILVFDYVVANCIDPACTGIDVITVSPKVQN